MNQRLLNIDTPLDSLNEWVKNSLIGNLGIEFTKTEMGLVEGFFILSKKNCRPDGILHGGTNLAMAETLAGLGSMLIVDNLKYDVFGAQISGNHTGVLKNGKAFAKAKIIHQGNKTHIWNVDITTEENRLISTVRVTNMIVLRND
jgi:uncharacterized protein (TIGR00369 family)